MNPPLDFYRWLRVFRLLDPHLSQFLGPNEQARAGSRIDSEGARKAEAAWLWEAVRGTAGIEDTYTGNRLVSQFQKIDAHPLDGLLVLADELVTFGDGHPRCTDQDIWQQLNFHLDTDLLIAARLACDTYPEQVLSTRDALAKHGSRLEASLAWPSVLAIECFCDDLVQREELIDTHVHLGTALPLSFYWVALMTEFAPARCVLSHVAQAEAWEEALYEAIQLRRRFARRMTGCDPDDLLASVNGVGWEDQALCPEPFVDYLLVHLVPQRGVRQSRNPVLGERYLLWFLLAMHARDHYDAHHIGFPVPGPVGDSDFDREDVLRYLRIRNSFIRELTYRPGEPGLDHFRRYLRIPRALTDTQTNKAIGERVRRMKRAFLSFERFRMRHALRYQFSDPTDAPWARDHGAGLEVDDFGHTTPWRPPRQVELRIKPIQSPMQKRYLHALLMGYRDFLIHDRDAPLLRMGLIIHTSRSSYRRSLAERQRHELEGIVAMLEEEPDFRPFVVGLDACGNERDLSPRHLREFFGLRPPPLSDPLGQTPDRQTGVLPPGNGDHFFGASRWDWLARRVARSPGIEPIRLRRTCHAGEDFCDLLSGLRWMDDSVVMLHLRPGERLGHGVALAWSPSDWYLRHRPFVYKPRLQHLVDLIWARRLLGENLPRFQWAPDNAALAPLDYLLKRFLVANGYPDKNIDQVLERCTAAYYEARSDRELIRPLLQLRQKDQTFAAGRIEAEVRAAHLDELISVEVTPDYVALVEACRARVRRRITAGDIVLELCPTSNVYIGGLQHYAELPYTNLNRHGLNDATSLKEPVLISINSDNPGLFRTTIAHEYRLIGAGLRAQGYGSREVARWLEEARQVGLASAFIPPWSPPSKPEMRARLNRLCDDFDLERQSR
ncbi:A-deaminase domain-containing protein [Sulfidibacter corallicola]|uniref:adenosine deaminase n=1 Tax=Sulfidibacter corallicola TaxID=2818388 RepID=A0A8A4TVD1_SULCO|nr:hypothetical protein [Sulfidibacter corallicola]QTD53443.1 hypothetical protein J3U87_13395 [Sulfidibacter corallicola]